MPTPTVPVSLRLTPELFTEAKNACMKAGISMNAWIADLVRQELGQDRPTVKAKKPSTPVKSYRRDPGLGEDEGE